MMRKLLLAGVAAASLGAGAFAYASQAAFAPRAETFRMLELFGNVLSLVERDYVVEVDDKKLIEAAMDGMLTSLDPHSNYLDAKEFKDFGETVRGAYGGLGLEVTSEDGAVKVITPMDDTPAARAGVQAGDVIIAIDGQSVLGQPLADAVKQMKGQPGTNVSITVVREGKDPFEVKLVREIINVKSVKTRMEGDYGVLRITNFNENTGRETVEGIESLKAKNPRMKGLVLDLRNNPGGVLQESVKVADAFLDGGEVVTQRGRDPRNIDRYNAQRGELLPNMPVVVLINAGSASAAEIVAGALQDRKRAVLVGVTSFGKGSVQQLIPLGDGKDGALRLTIARYYTPSGRSIQKTGIEPDLEVAQSKEQAERLADAKFQFSEASFKNALNADEGKTRRGAHTIAEFPPVSFDPKKGDYQLTRAFDVLAAGGDLEKVKKAVPTTVAQAPETQAAAVAKTPEPAHP